MGSNWVDPLEPNEYPLAPNWHHAIAQASQLRLQPSQFRPVTGTRTFYRWSRSPSLPRWIGRDPLDPGPPPDHATTQAEIDDLVNLATTQRELRMNEILSQYTGHHLYYLGLLMIRQETHPATYLLMKIATNVAAMTMAYFKYKYKRPRPVQYCPALMPPLDTTAHPSYPNGHALYGLMKAYAVADVVPQMLEPMLALAERVWCNAEIGGFHYASDAAAARKIADAAMPLLRNCPGYRDAVAAAGSGVANFASDLGRGGVIPLPIGIAMSQ